MFVSFLSTAEKLQLYHYSKKATALPLQHESYSTNSTAEKLQLYHYSIKATALTLQHQSYSAKTTA
jgi:hypothetical protein